MLRRIRGRRYSHFLSGSGWFACCYRHGCLEWTGFLYEGYHGLRAHSLICFDPSGLFSGYAGEPECGVGRLQHRLSVIVFAAFQEEVADARLGAQLLQPSQSRSSSHHM